VGSRLSSPGPQQRRFAAYIEGLANAAGHADRHTPLKNYCTGLLLPGERKSVEPMAARLAPDKVRRMHQSLARQYCGELGKSDNCQAAVSLSVSTGNSSLPIAWRSYLPEVWCQDAERCRKAGVAEGVTFQTKPDLALQQIRQAIERQVSVGVVLADAGYGKGTQFRTALTQIGLTYVVGIESNATVWKPGQQPLPAPERKPGRGATPKRLQRSADHQPISVKPLALRLPSSAWKEIGWRNFALSVRRRPRASRASRLQADRTISRGMAFDRMAQKGIGAHPILAIHFAEENLTQVFGEDGQTPLDHRARL